VRRIGTEETVALTEQWNVTYNLRERDRGDALRTVEMTWENRTPAQVAENLNAFLLAAGAPLKVVLAE